MKKFLWLKCWTVVICYLLRMMLNYYHLFSVAVVACVCIVASTLNNNSKINICFMYGVRTTSWLSAINFFETYSTFCFYQGLEYMIHSSLKRRKIMEDL